jgi:hypothetical protein
VVVVVVVVERLKDTMVTESKPVEDEGMRLYRTLPAETQSVLYGFQHTYENLLVHAFAERVERRRVCGDRCLLTARVSGSNDIATVSASLVKTIRSNKVLPSLSS